MLVNVKCLFNRYLFPSLKHVTVIIMLGTVRTIKP